MSVTIPVPTRYELAFITQEAIGTNVSTISEHGSTETSPTGNVVFLADEEKQEIYKANGVDPYGDQEPVDSISATHIMKSQNYSVSFMHIDARIIQADENIVTLECLVDGELESREFPRSIVEGPVPIKYHQLVQIRVSEQPGKISFTFLNGRKLVNPDIFERDDLFAGLEGRDYLSSK